MTIDQALEHEITNTSINMKINYIDYQQNLETDSTSLNTTNIQLYDI